jgi:hypothetical protein
MEESGRKSIQTETSEPYEIWSAVARDEKELSADSRRCIEHSPGISQRRGMSGHGNDFIMWLSMAIFVHMTCFDSRSGF